MADGGDGRCVGGDGSEEGRQMVAVWEEDAGTTHLMEACMYSIEG